MRRRARPILAVGALLLGGAGIVPVAQAAESASSPDPNEVKVFRAEVTSGQVPLLLAAGQDGRELSEQVPAKGTATVEVYLTDQEAEKLEGQGVELTEHTLTAKAEARVDKAAEGVFRPYSGSGGLQEEILATARANPGLTKVVSIGKTVNGKDILALKLTKNAKKSKDGAKPSVLYMSNQHAREWITPEMTRRLLHYYVDGYKTDKRLKKIVDSTELWFVLSANPDGYDYTFQNDDNRLWRKNLHDNNGDGTIGVGDGVDLNRNFSYKWGYDNEGSSPNPTSETYRGAAPSSEPETKALDTFEKRIGFTYGINYHSAAELLLYGVGWQVATDTPDDIMYKALAGTPDNSAIPGYRPQVSSELYTTNGEADGHASNVNGLAMFTPEMSTCQTASDLDPNDQWNAADCQSVFNFPDDEKLIQQEFEKNIPFALSVAESAARPDQPKSSLGLKAADFTPKPFTTSYSRGADQEVSVVVRKAVRDKELKYRVNGGRTKDRRSGPGRAARRTAVRTTSTSTSTGPRSRTPIRATRSRSGSPAGRRAESPPPARTSPTRWPSGRARTCSWSPRRARPPHRRRPTWTPSRRPAAGRSSGTSPHRARPTRSACWTTSGPSSTTRARPSRAIPPSSSCAPS